LEMKFANFKFLANKKKKKKNREKTKCGGMGLAGPPSLSNKFCMLERPLSPPSMAAVLPKNVLAAT